MTKRVIELLRVSTVGQADDSHASIPSQRTINQRTCEQYGLTIVKTIELIGVSGTAVLLTPEIQDMLRMMADPEIHGVVAREFSRLMRPENLADFALLQAFAESNCKLYLPDGPIDFSSNDGRLMGTLKATIAGNVRREMLKAAWESRETKRRRGELAQPKICLPFGVDNEKTRWWYTPEAEKIREAFRMVLEGETSYFAIGKKVGIEPRGLAYMLKNPIYSGWRVIDKKRDMSAAGKYHGPDGRQAGRRTIKRAPEEIIRVKVIDEPLVSESDFALVQKILGMKKSFHWRTSPGYEQRYTYNGYLECTCQSRVYSKHMRKDYYVCKNRCGVRQMRREIVDPQLDQMFARTFQSEAFIRRIARAGSQPTVNTDNVARQLEALTAKRERVLDTYYEGAITREERDQKLKEIDRERQVFEGLLGREKPSAINTELLTKRFAVFRGFERLTRDQKRRILNTITPRIVVANYEVEGMSCSLPRTLTDRRSSPPPA
ncbi:MAG TPA: recombinase family protein [Pyrinomonadaceae bacterium]|nr:recombinase family protein [Pyrinomonadaceae bacterium]